MSARTHQQRTHYAADGGSPTRGPIGGGAGEGAGGRAGTAAIRLPWWAVALPVLAFVVLLSLIAGGGEAHATGGDPAVGRILEQIRDTLAR
ncbi:hypothetical protein [Streptomyces lavendofoliae]|uniref:hypothetical protein n=1 Tax=Streptomyces lavendofoliae TaxID=67314 RepID=UPI00300F0148